MSNKSEYPDPELENTSWPSLTILLIAVSAGSGIIQLVDVWNTETSVDGRIWIFLHAGMTTLVYLGVWHLVLSFGLGVLTPKKTPTLSKTMLVCIIVATCSAANASMFMVIAAFAGTPALQVPIVSLELAVKFFPLSILTCLPFLALALAVRFKSA